MKSRIKVRKRGKSVGKATSCCQLHLLITRPSGDTEKYLLTEVPNMTAAVAYRNSQRLALRKAA